MLTLGLTQDEAEDALVRLAAHVPLDVEIGRPELVFQDHGYYAIVTDGPVWWLYTDGYAERFQEVAPGLDEVTQYARRVQILWTIGHSA